MGFFSSLTGRDAAVVTAAYPPAYYSDPSTLPIASPWSSSDLQRIVAEDIFGDTLPENTRAAAMTIQALARAVNLMKSSIGRMPLVQLTEGEQLPPADDPAARAAFRLGQPTWLYRTDGPLSPQHRMAWTVDDLIFYGWSCWSRTNDARSRFPLTAVRVNQGDWTINADNKVEINGVVQRDEDVIVFSGFHEGILSYGHTTIRDTRNLYKVVGQRIAAPIPPVDLHQTGGTPLTKTEREELVAEWTAARQKSTGGVGYSNASIEVKVLDANDDGKLMIEARNAAAVDVARMVGVSAGMIDATAPKASLNYETQTGRNQEFVDLDLWLYLGPIAARLSMDDCSPAGSHIAFDLSDFTAPTPSPTGPNVQD